MLHVYRGASILMKADILGVPDVPSLDSFATSGKLAMHSLQIQEHPGTETWVKTVKSQ